MVKRRLAEIGGEPGGRPCKFTIPALGSGRVWGLSLVFHYANALHGFASASKTVNANGYQVFPRNGLTFRV